MMVTNRGICTAAYFCSVPPGVLKSWGGEVLIGERMLARGEGVSLKRKTYRDRKVGGPSN